ncbi:hypothetical protein NXK88_002778 [Enterococcus hirae]|uniref:hypothetical protein n=1 Tax=Enterococcus hirae TaxID=1354 RepID=UPI0020743BAB|nr:hypothetical protein [Enterococcus hirae]EMF0203495.1 hypothetical protein [Enterococcus hirae]
MLKKKKSLVGWLGVGLVIGGLAYSTETFSMERHEVYLKKNYVDKSMVSKEKQRIMDDNCRDPHQQFQTIDESESSNWGISTIDGYRGLASKKDKEIVEENTNLLEGYSYKFEDASTLFKVIDNTSQNNQCISSKYIGLNKQTNKITISTYNQGRSSTCFTKTVKTEPGKEYHFSMNIEANRVIKKRIGTQSIEESQFNEKKVLVAFLNKDASQLACTKASYLDKEGNTYSIDLLAKTDKTTICIFLANLDNSTDFYSAQISNVSLNKK